MHDSPDKTSSANWQTVAAETPVSWPLRVWILGAATHQEFRSCVEQIIARTDVTLLSRLSSDLGEVVGAAEPDLCVVLASRPGEFTAESIESLRQQAPLVRMVGLLGSWCEGGARTGHPWPAVPRIYWHRWQAWFERELAAWERGECNTLSLPLTATDEERLLDGIASSGKHDGTTVAIHRAAHETAAMLSEACQALGYRNWPYFDGHPRASHPPAIGIYDAGACDAASIEEFRRLAAERPSTRWLVLMNFPRADDERRWREAGAAAIMSKPLAIDELSTALALLTSD